MKRASLFAALVVLLASVSAAGSVAAKTCVTFQVMGTDLSLKYNPFAPQPVNHPFQLRVTRDDPTVTAVRFIMVDATPIGGRSRIGAAGPYDYDVTWLGDTGQPVFYYGGQSVNGSNGVTTVFGSGPTGSTQSLPFQLHIPQGQPVAASQQFENIEVVYQCTTGSTNVWTGPQQNQYDNRVSIRLAIPRYFGAYIGSPGQSHGRIDFGTLAGATNFDEKRAAVTAVSTVPYTVGIRTDHGSMLKRSDDAVDGIPYTMKFAEAEVTDNSQLRCPMTQSSLGDTEQLKVKLNGAHLHDLAAGSYRDTITLTFTPLDGAPVGTGCVVQ